jgi:branched-chain amino acid transport system ATP-binding protein
LSAPILEARNASCRFGGLLALKSVSVAVAPGELLGLIGPNGAGKSTLFNLIAGAFPPTEGQILFEGREIQSLSPAERCRLGIARTFQVPRSFDSMTVLENVTVGALVRHAGARAARRAALAVLDELGLAHRADAPAGDLNPPEKRRLELGRALATEPKLLLLDEVLTGLTPSEAQAGVAIVRGLRARGVTIVMVEHVMEVVMPLVDRAVVLNLGEALAEGKPADVVRDERVIAAYLGSKRRAA